RAGTPAERAAAAGGRPPQPPGARAGSANRSSQRSPGYDADLIAILTRLSPPPSARRSDSTRTTPPAAAPVFFGPRSSPQRLQPSPAMRARRPSLSASVHATRLLLPMNSATKLLAGRP